MSSCIMLEKLTKTFAIYLAIFKNVGKTFFHTKISWGLFWAETHPQSKFRGNPLSSSHAKLLTNQPTKNQTDTGENITSFAEENNSKIMSTLTSPNVLFCLCNSLTSKDIQLTKKSIIEKRPILGLEKLQSRTGLSF